MKTKLTKSQKLAAAKKELEKTLRMSGVYRLKAKYGDEDYRQPFPDLTTQFDGAPTSNVFANPTGKKERHKDAKNFPIANNHKQGYELVIRKEDIVFMGGKKT